MVSAFGEARKWRGARVPGVFSHAVLVEKKQTGRRAKSPNVAIWGDAGARAHGRGVVWCGLAWCERDAAWHGAAWRDTARRTSPATPPLPLPRAG
jgi:hypothetical protein